MAFKSIIASFIAIVLIIGGVIVFRGFFSSPPITSTPGVTSTPTPLPAPNPTPNPTPKPAPVPQPSPTPPLPPSPLPPKQTEIHVYYTYGIPDKDTTGPFTSNNNHPLLSAAFINAGWIAANPREGVFDWTLLDKKVSDWTGSANPNQDTPKKIFIRIATYGQTPMTADECKNYGSNCIAGDNDNTPPWIYGQGVPRITFVCGGVCKGQKTASVPKVWDPKFLVAYETFFTALGEHYNNDKRVAGFLPGFGHLGTMNAQPSKEGAIAFANAGWTPEIWRSYIENVLDISKRHLTKRLIIRTPGKFLENVNGTSYKLGDHLDMAKEILKYSAERDISILFHGLTPNDAQYKDAAIPELVTYLGSLNIHSASFAIGFDDDWPLLVPDDRANKCPGPTCGRNIVGFEKELQEAFTAWESIGKKYPIFFAFLEPEASATNPNNKGQLDKGGNEVFRQNVYDMVIKYLTLKAQ